MNYINADHSLIRATDPPTPNSSADCPLLLTLLLLFLTPLLSLHHTALYLFSCHVMSCPTHCIVSRLMSCRLMSNTLHCISSHVMSCHVMSNTLHCISPHVMSCHVYLLASCHVVSTHRQLRDGRGPAEGTVRQKRLFPREGVRVCVRACVCVFVFVCAERKARVVCAESTVCLCLC
jgi:hypothetical protein